MDEHTISPAGDPFYAEAQRNDGDDYPHPCWDGIVFIGHMVDDYMGGEVEIFWPAPCRRCAVVDGSRSSPRGDDRL